MARVATLIAFGKEGKASSVAVGAPQEMRAAFKDPQGKLGKPLPWATRLIYLDTDGRTRKRTWEGVTEAPSKPTAKRPRKA